MRTEKDCHELLIIFARIVDTAVIGICIVAALWLLRKKQKFSLLPALNFSKTVLAEKEVKTKEKVIVDEKCLPKCSKANIDQKKSAKKKSHSKPVALSNKSTQTCHEYSTIWKAVWVAEDGSSEDISTQRHKSEFFINFQTGQISRKEEVFHKRQTHIIASLDL